MFPFELNHFLLLVQLINSLKFSRIGVEESDNVVLRSKEKTLVPHEVQTPNLADEVVVANYLFFKRNQGQYDSQTSQANEK
jgi:hypothetical protein